MYTHYFTGDTLANPSNSVDTTKLDEKSSQVAAGPPPKGETRVKSTEAVLVEQSKAADDNADDDDVSVLKYTKCCWRRNAD